LNIRAGIVIRCRNWILVQHPTPSAKWPNPLFDLPKGHLRQGESPKDAAIRECWEETNIKFESWKLENPIQVQYSNEPLFLFLVNLNSPIPVEQLSCTATFIDQDGKRKPECDGYVWINPYKQIHLVQQGLRSGIMYYFNKFRYSEDCQIAGPMMGSLPPNVGSILSLGYKSGGILPHPKKKIDSEDYKSIPHL
jgi:8-oxo-dGTP pyrophosphatase MutT (NUDIX family)